MPLNWGPRSGNGEQREAHEPNQKLVSLMIRRAKGSVPSLKTHTHNHLYTYTYTDAHRLSLIV